MFHQSTWFGLMPLSMTATPIPVPLYPAFQAVLTFIASFV